MNTDIGDLYGVGTAKKQAYARLGINTVYDLLCHYPRGYEDRGNIKLLSEADGETNTDIFWSSPQSLAHQG